MPLSGVDYVAFLCSYLMFFSHQEFKKIRAFKGEKCGIKFGDLEPWDEAYYTSLMKSSTYTLDSSVSLKLLLFCMNSIFFLFESVVIREIFIGQDSFLLLLQGHFS